MTTMNPSIRRAAAAVGIAGAAMTALSGAIVQAIVQPATNVSDRLWSYPWSASAFVPVSTLYAALHVLVIVGLLGLASSDAAGSNKAGRRGLAIAVAGTALLLVGELASLPIRHSRVDDMSAQFVGALFGLGCLVSAVGFLVAGRAIARAGLWQGWRRWTVLIVGIWTAVLVGLGTTKLLAAGVAVYGVCLVTVFLAMRATTAPAAVRRDKAMQPA